MRLAAPSGVLDLVLDFLSVRFYLVAAVEPDSALVWEVALSQLGARAALRAQPLSRIRARRLGRFESAHFVQNGDLLILEARGVASSFALAIYNARTGRRHRQLPGSDIAVLAISPEGDKLLCRYDAVKDEGKRRFQIAMIDLASVGGAVVPLPGQLEGRKCHRALFSPGGETFAVLATLGEQIFVEVWDSSSLALLCSRSLPESRIVVGAIAFDGDSVAMCHSSLHVATVLHVYRNASGCELVASEVADPCDDVSLRGRRILQLHGPRATIKSMYAGDARALRNAIKITDSTFPMGSFSPDGNKVLLLEWQFGSGNTRSRVWALGGDGGAAPRGARVTFGGRPSFSPDGEVIAGLAKPGLLLVMAANQTNEGSGDESLLTLDVGRYINLVLVSGPVAR